MGGKWLHCGPEDLESQKRCHPDGETGWGVIGVGRGEEARGSGGMNAGCEKTIKEQLGGGGRTVKSVGRKTGTDEVGRELVRGGGATGPKSRKKFRPMIEEETLTVSQWSVPNLGRGHREHLADSGNACRGRTYRSGSEAQESIREVDFSSWEPTIYKKNL